MATILEQNLWNLVLLCIGVNSWAKLANFVVKKCKFQLQMHHFLDKGVPILHDPWEWGLIARIKWFFYRLKIAHLYILIFSAFQNPNFQKCWHPWLGQFTPTGSWCQENCSASHCLPIAVVLHSCGLQLTQTQNYSDVRSFVWTQNNCSNDR